MINHWKKLAFSYALRNTRGGRKEIIQFVFPFSDPNLPTTVKCRRGLAINHRRAGDRRAESSWPWKAGLPSLSISEEGSKNCWLSGVARWHVNGIENILIMQRIGVIALGNHQIGKKKKKELFGWIFDLESQCIEFKPFYLTQEETRTWQGLEIRPSDHTTCGFECPDALYGTLTAPLARPPPFPFFSLSVSPHLGKTLSVMYWFYLIPTCNVYTHPKIRLWSHLYETSAHTAVYQVLPGYVVIARATESKRIHGNGRAEVEGTCHQWRERTIS